MKNFSTPFYKSNYKFLTAQTLSIKIIIKIIDNEENTMANPTFGEKKRIQTMLLVTAYM